MPTVQPGILALGTRNHHHLEFDLEGGDPDRLVAALAGLREPAVTAGGANLVLGFGAVAWRALAPDRTPDDLTPFTTVEGPGGVMPAVQHDLWIWVHGSGTDVVLDTSRAVAAALAPVASLAAEQQSFVYRESRDLTGFIDGTENPRIDEVSEVIGVPIGPGAGGSHVLLQRWVHDLAAFHALPLTEQEDVIGRTKADSVELDEDRMPPAAHIARTVIEDDHGEELELFRRSTAFGGVRTHGLVFVGFSGDRARLDRMTARMVGAEDGVSDRLLRFSRPVDGAVYFTPCLEDLAALR